MADPNPHPHQPVWFWAGSSVLAIGGVVATVYGTRASGGYDWLAPAMWVAYGLAVLSAVCFIGAIRRWHFPFSKRADDAPPLGPFLVHQVPPDLQDGHTVSSSVRATHDPETPYVIESEIKRPKGTTAIDRVTDQLKRAFGDDPGEVDGA